MVTLANPHLGTNTEAGWAMGFSWGFVGPAFSSQPPPCTTASLRNPPQER